MDRCLNGYLHCSALKTEPWYGWVSSWFLFVHVSLPLQQQVSVTWSFAEKRKKEKRKKKDLIAAVNAFSHYQNYKACLYKTGKIHFGQFRDPKRAIWFDNRERMEHLLDSPITMIWRCQQTTIEKILKWYIPFVGVSIPPKWKMVTISSCNFETCRKFYPFIC